MILDIKQIFPRSFFVISALGLNKYLWFFWNQKLKTIWMMMMGMRIRMKDNNEEDQKDNEEEDDDNNQIITYHTFSESKLKPILMMMMLRGWEWRGGGQGGGRG